MTDLAELDRLLSEAESAPSSFTGATERHTHDYQRVVLHRCRCGAERDDGLFRRGRRSDRLGKDQERRIERTFGPKKVGQFGDAIDLIGAAWKWQSKATRAEPPLYLVGIDEPVQRHSVDAVVVAALAAMDPLRPDLLPVVIRSFVANGKATRDWCFVRGADVGEAAPYVVMSGRAWLERYGADRP